ncbi:hypothetical protein [Novosphingobium resinovorum]|uniref:hypothetical protein n=1 Tax=Novosphingobium resinovorum TaxID=158500 RepID=UPI0012EA8066|nr:hypothetical protein [Novosphingobium resinovorum]
MTPVQSFFIDIDYDPECQRRYVAETKFPGLISNGTDPWRFVSRLLDLQIWPEPKGLDISGLASADHIELLIAVVKIFGRMRRGSREYF